jgi:hypothetical protein
MSDRSVIDQARRLLRLAPIAATHREPSLSEDLERINKTLANDDLEISPVQKEGKS